MKDYLQHEKRSLGGEFFLASRDQIERAWRESVAAADSMTTS